MKALETPALSRAKPYTTNLKFLDKIFQRCSNRRRALRPRLHELLCLRQQHLALRLAGGKHGLVLRAQRARLD
jgi:hypothetical protein